MPLIALVRHGDVIDPADFFTSLTEAGKWQAQRVADELRLGYPRAQWRRIISSQYQRCIETAYLVSRHLRLDADETPRPEIDRSINEVGDLCDKNKTSVEMKLRVVNFLSSKILSGCGDLVIVSHGGPIQEMAKFLGHPTGACDRGQKIAIEYPA